MDPSSAPPAAPADARLRVRTVLVIALIALVLRAALILGGADVRRGPRDLEDRYDKIAHSLLEGKGFSRGGNPTATSPPLYPLLLAGIYATLGESNTTLMLVLALLDACAAGLCAAVAWRLLGREVGVLAGLAVAFSPYSVYSVLLAGTDTFSVFLTWAALFVLLGALDRRRGWLFLAAGAVLGLAALCRGAALLLPLFLVPLALAGRAVPWRRRVLHAAALVLGAVAVLAPWTARNWVRFHQFIPVQTLGGLHVLQGAPMPSIPGIPPQYDGSTKPGQIGRWDQKFNPTNAARDADYYKTAWGRIKARPFVYLRNLLGHVLTMWFRTQTSDFRGFLVPVNCAMLALAFTGLVMKRREFWGLALIWLPIVYYVGVHAFTYPVLRFLLPIIPALTTLAAIPVAWALARLRRSPVAT